MGTPFATYRDVEPRWRPLSEAERSLADQLTDDASAMIRDRWPDADARVTSGALSATTLTRIVALMAKRAMIGGDAEGLESQQQAAGPFSVNQTYANPNGNLYFTASDVTLLDGTGFLPRSRVGWLA